MYNKKIETLPLAKLRKVQSKLLKSLISRLYKRDPFYKKLFDELGIQPGDISGESTHPVVRLGSRRLLDIRKMILLYSTRLLRDRWFVQELGRE